MSLENKTNKNVNPFIKDLKKWANYYSFKSQEDGFLKTIPKALISSPLMLNPVTKALLRPLVYNLLTITMIKSTLDFFAKHPCKFYDECSKREDNLVGWNEIIPYYIREAFTCDTPFRYTCPGRKEDIRNREEWANFFKKKFAPSKHPIRYGPFD